MLKRILLLLALLCFVAASDDHLFIAELVDNLGNYDAIAGAAALVSKPPETEMEAAPCGAACSPNTGAVLAEISSTATPAQGVAGQAGQLAVVSMNEAQRKEAEARAAIEKLKIDKAELEKQAAGALQQAAKYDLAAEKAGLDVAAKDKEKEVQEQKEQVERAKLTTDQAAESALKTQIGEVRRTLDEVRTKKKLKMKSYIEQNKAAKALEIKARSKMADVEAAKIAANDKSRQVQQKKDQLLAMRRKLAQARDAIALARKELSNTILTKKREFREGKAKAREDFIAHMEEERKQKADHEEDAHKNFEMDERRLEDELGEQKQKLTDEIHEVHETAHKCKENVRKQLRDAINKAEGERLQILEDAHRKLDSAPNPAEAQNINNAAHQKVAEVRTKFDNDKAKLEQERKNCNVQRDQATAQVRDRIRLVELEFEGKIKAVKENFRGQMQTLSDGLRAIINQLYEARKTTVQALAKDFYESKLQAEKNVQDHVDAYHALKRDADDVELAVGHVQSVLNEATQKLSRVEEIYRKQQDEANVEREKAHRLKAHTMELKKKVVELLGDLKQHIVELKRMEKKLINDQKAIDTAVAKAKQLETARDESSKRQEEEKKQADRQRQIAQEKQAEANAIQIPTLDSAAVPAPPSSAAVAQADAAVARADSTIKSAA